MGDGYICFEFKFSYFQCQMFRIYNGCEGERERGLGESCISNNFLLTFEQEFLVKVGFNVNTIHVQ